MNLMLLAFIVSIILPAPMALYAQDEYPSLGQGDRSAFRIVDERGVDWGQMASSCLYKDEGGYSCLTIYKAGSDFLISRSDLPDDPMDFFMNTPAEQFHSMEYHLRGKVYQFTLRSSKLKAVLLPEGKLENADAYQYILDKIYRDGGQLFFDFENCSDYQLEEESASASEEKDEPEPQQSDEPERPAKAIELLCSSHYRFIPADIPCSDIEGAAGLSCKEIEDAMYCRTSMKSFMETFRKAQIQESIAAAVDDFDRCKKDQLYFKITISFLMLTKNGKRYADQFEEYLNKKKIDPLNYVPPKKPMYGDLCIPLRSYLLLKQKLKGLAALDKACGSSIPSDHYVLQLARQGMIETVNPGSEIAQAELFRFLRPFLAGEKVPDDLLVSKCDNANPRNHFRLALSRIATGKYDPADFYEFYKYYPLFRDLVDGFTARREQAIKAREKAEKEKAAKPPAPAPASN